MFLLGMLIETIVISGVLPAVLIFSIARRWDLWNVWAMSVNPFFSGAIRIQTDRGQRVTREGPYAFLRHPGHAGGILAFVAARLALNSLISILPVVLIELPILIYRTIVEEQMLRDELAGYVAYATKVPYRLIPGVW
jgi:protein-S-isoprenylcysteine O-methyltransferase Ste14